MEGRENSSPLCREGSSQPSTDHRSPLRASSPFHDLRRLQSRTNSEQHPSSRPSSGAQLTVAPCSPHQRSAPAGRLCADPIQAQPSGAWTRRHRHLWRRACDLRIWLLQGHTGQPRAAVSRNLLKEPGRWLSCLCDNPDISDPQDTLSRLPTDALF